MSGSDSSGDRPQNLTVYYDGGCPICRREIDLYRRQNGAEFISWVDVADQKGDQVTADLSRQTALSRFHVRQRDGRLVSGAAAFAALWSALPAWRLPGRILALPGIRHAAEVMYGVFLLLRPLLQRVTLR